MEPKLNEEQRRAVEHGQGAMLVVAGAGTGKTQVITQRIARMILKKIAKPEEILALTFTEKAAGEMLERLDGLVGWEAYRVNVMTFHAFGAQLLQRFGHHMGWSSRGEVISQTAAVMLMRQHLSEVELRYYGGQSDLTDFLSGVLGYIQVLQNGDVGLERFEAYVEEQEGNPELHRLDKLELRDRLSLFQLYEKLKAKYGFIDYHDQLALPLRLLQERPNIVERLKEQYKYVLVDEYQDTNAVQDELLRALIPPGGNIFAVGDDDQAIYGFRGARLSNILQFTDHFQVDQPLVLTQNYRSTQNILDAAYRLIRHNDPDRLEVKLGLNKRLRALDHGPEPEFTGYETSQQEYEGTVAGLIRSFESGTPPENLAVLATTHAPLRGLARVLRSRGLPYRISSTVNIFEQPEILQLWHLVRWIGMEADNEAIVQLLPGPLIGWPIDRVRLVSECCRRELVTAEEALHQLQQSDPEIKRLLEKLHKWRAWAAAMGPSQLLYQLVFESELSREWIEQAAESARMVRVFEDLQQWLRHAQQFEAVAIDPMLKGYLSIFPTPPEIEAEEAVGDEHGVALLTVHASKGLEFDEVYVINCTREAWSEGTGGRRVELPSELAAADLELPPEHERRRLLYVAMTRAKRKLTLSAPLRQASGTRRKLTPYLAEIFPETDFEQDYQVEDVGKLEKALRELQQYSPKNLLWSAPRLPFETADGWLELSTTDLQAYQDCPWEFYLSRVLGIRLPLGTPVAFGSLLHGLIHDYYLSRQSGDPLSLDQLQQRLQDRWQKHGYETVQAAELDQSVARQTLAAFYEREQQAKRNLVAAEENISLTLPEAKLKLKGRIDALFAIEGGLEIRDFKTGRSVRDQDKAVKNARDSLQLRTYALALQERGGEPVARVVLDYVVTGVEGATSLSSRIMSNHRVKLTEIAEKIRQRQFAPTPGPYHECVMARYWGNPQEEIDEA